MNRGGGKEFGRVDRGLPPEQGVGNFAFHPALQEERGCGDLSSIGSIKDDYHTRIGVLSLSRIIPSALEKRFRKFALLVGRR